MGTGLPSSYCPVMTVTSVMQAEGTPAARTALDIGQLCCDMIVLSKDQGIRLLTSIRRRGERQGGGCELIMALLPCQLIFRLS